MHGTTYYALLARTLPPGELGQAVWRRFRRAARKGVRRVSPEPTVDLNAFLRLECVDDLARKMRAARAARAPIEPEERPEARRLLSECFPEHPRLYCERADRILAGEVPLFGVWREHARGELAPGIAALDWTRNPFDGAHAPAGPATGIDRDAVGTDSRAVWELGRLNPVFWLAQAHFVVGLRGTEYSRGIRDRGLYARAAVLHVRDFLATQPVRRGIHWTCAMEAALRVLRLSAALLLLRDASELDAFFWREVTEALVAHGRFIEDEIEDSQTVPGNHYLTDLAGLATIGCLFPELPCAAAWRMRALPEFSRELLRQTQEDGFTFEASLPYHRFVTELALVLQSFARKQGLSLGAPALGRLWRMCDVVEAATLPDDRLPSIGDNDSTKAFEVELRSSLETRHIGALRSALGGPGIPSSLEPEALWLGGVAGLRRNVSQAAASLQDHRAAHHRFHASGLSVLRDNRACAVTLWAGENGQHGLGGHAHNDKLSSEVVLHGLRFVVDPGCPSYLADPAERDRYRSTAAHPTLQVDELEQAPIPPGRPFLLPEFARASLVRTEPQSVWAEHRGYLRLRPGVTHRREVALPPGADAVSITDWVLGTGAHVLDLRWPFSSREAMLRAATDNERALLEGLESLPFGNGRFDLDRIFALGWPGRAGTLALLAMACEQSWEAELVESTWSPGYGERVCGRTAHLRVRAECPAAITSVFVWVGEGGANVA
jgi:hypothetical protein